LYQNIRKALAAIEIPLTLHTDNVIFAVDAFVFLLQGPLISLYFFGVLSSLLVRLIDLGMVLSLFALKITFGSLSYFLLL